MSRIMDPDGLPPAVGFAHAIETSGERTMYVAGQTGHRADGTIDDDLVEQFRQALANVTTCMEEGGFPRGSLVRMIIYTTDIDAYRAALRPLGEVYRQTFGYHYPAMALLGVTALIDPAAKIELVCTAVL